MLRILASDVALILLERERESSIFLGLMASLLFIHYNNFVSLFVFSYLSSSFLSMDDTKITKEVSRQGFIGITCKVVRTCF